MTPAACSQLPSGKLVLELESLVLIFLSFSSQYFPQTGFSWFWINLICCLRSRSRSWTGSCAVSLGYLLFVWSHVTPMKDCRTSSQCCTAVSKLCELLWFTMFWCIRAKTTYIIHLNVPSERLISYAGPLLQELSRSACQQNPKIWLLILFLPLLY